MLKTYINTNDQVQVDQISASTKHLNFDNRY